MSAAGRVDVVVARVPAELRRPDPTLQGERLAMRRGLRHVDRPGLDLVLRPPRHRHGVSSRGEVDRLARVPVDLRVEPEVGGQATGLGRVDPPPGVPDEERGGRRPTVEVPDVEGHGHGGIGAEEDVEVAPEAEVLGPLPHVEADLRLPTARVPAVNLEEPVFEREARQRPIQGAVDRDGQVHPPVGDLGGREPRRGPGGAGRSAVDGRGVGAGRLQLGGHARLVVDLDQEGPPSALDQLRRHRPRFDLDPALGVDRHADQAERVEHLLDRSDPVGRLRLGQGLVELRPGRGREGLAEQVERLDHPSDLGGERLGLDPLDSRQAVGLDRADQEGQEDTTSGDGSWHEERPRCLGRHGLQRSDATPRG